MRRGAEEPLSIWFFAGAILAIFGAVVLAAGLLVEPPGHVVLVTSPPPGVWWGAGMIVVGLLFTALGLKGGG